MDGFLIPIQNAPKFVGALNYYRTVAPKWDIGLRMGILQQEAKATPTDYNYFSSSFRKIDATTRFSLINSKHFRWAIEGGFSMGKFTEKFHQSVFIYPVSGDNVPSSMTGFLYGFSTGMSLDAKIGKHFHAGANLIANFYTNNTLKIPTNLPTLRVAYSW